MKKSFKLIAAVAVFLTLGIAFMANSYKTDNNTKAENPPPCWIEPTVYLHGECVKYNQNTQYVINVKIYNTCNNPSTLLYDDTQSFGTDNGNQFNFCISDTICVTDIGEDCYQVVTSAAKISTINNEVFCSGQTINNYDCEELTNLSIIHVYLN